MTVLKHVGVMSMAKITALFGLVAGLIYGILFSTMAAAFAPLIPGLGATGAGALGIFIVVIGAILGLIVGFISGAIQAFLYNVFAGWVGGIQVDLV